MKLDTSLNANQLFRAVIVFQRPRFRKESKWNLLLISNFCNVCKN